MKKSVRLTSLALCLLMTATCFTGCKKTKVIDGGWISDDSGYIIDVSDADSAVSSGKGGKTQGGAVKNNNSKTPSNATASGEGITDKFIKSLKGTQVKIFTMREEKPERGTTSGDRYYSVLKKVAKKYGASIDTVDVDVSGLMTSILSGKPTANVISVNDYSLYGYLKSNAAANLNDAMKTTGITFREEWYNQDGRKLLNISNKQYGWISDITSPYFIFYNKRLVQAQGLEDPFKVYQKGNWSYDTFYNYATKLNAKATDGSVISRGLGIADWVVLATQLTYRNNGSIYDIKGGKMVINTDSPNTMNGLSFTSKLIQSGAVAAGGPSGWNQQFVNFAKGSVAMILSTKYIVSVMNDQNMTDAVGIVPLPYGPDAGKNAKIAYDQLYATIIPKPCANEAAKILYLMNEVNQENYKNRKKDFESDYRAVIRDTAAYNLFSDCSLKDNDAAAKFDMISGTYSILNEFSGILESGTAAEAVNSFKGAMKSGVSDNWGSITFTGF